MRMVVFKLSNTFFNWLRNSNNFEKLGFTDLNKRAESFKEKKLQRKRQKQVEIIKKAASTQKIKTSSRNL